MNEAQKNDEEKNVLLIEKFEKHKNELKVLAVQLEGRVNHLQSNAFQLANVFFVFQGIIFAATGINAKTGLHCSLRWLPTTLSVLALLLNLIAFLAILQKYNLTLEKIDQTWSLSNEYEAKIQNLRILKKQENEVSKKTHGPQDPWRNFIVWPSLAIFLAFETIMIVGFWKIPCSLD